MMRAARWPNRGERTRARPFSGIARGYPSSVSGYAFSDSQADLVTGDKLRAIVGDKVADRLRDRFTEQPHDQAGYRLVDLGDDELAVMAALRELSPDAGDSDEQQVTETLLKGLAGQGDGPV